MIIGLTGSIAMGKSEVANIIRTLNIPVFDADATVHEIYQNGTAAKALANLCHEAVSGNTVDRSILSHMIANNPDLLKSITAIIHPLVQDAEHRFRIRHQNKLAVIDSPLILEAGRAQEMDLIIVVSALPELQKQRAMARPGMTDAKFNLILSKQMPDEEKRKWADYVIENNGSFEELDKITRTLFSQISKTERPHA